MGQNRGFKGRQFTAAVILWAVRWYGRDVNLAALRRVLTALRS
jgi:transposase-like protein